MSIFKKKLTVNEAINKAHTSAVNIPLDKITEDRILRRFPDKETSLYIIGSYNFRPEKAVKAFKKLGYKNAIFGGNMEEHYGMLKK